MGSMIPFRWTIGTRALTKGGRFPLLNAGHLVVIVWYDPSRFDRHGRMTPFQVQRIDGDTFPVTGAMDSTGLSFGRYTTIWISEFNLEVLPDLVSEDEVEEELNLRGPNLADARPGR